MNILLVDTDRNLSSSEVSELEEYLSKLPTSHIKNLESIQICKDLGNKVLAQSSSWGRGNDIDLSAAYLSLPKHEREFAFFHEMGHNYYDHKDEVDGDRSFIRLFACPREKVVHLLRVQWMELGKWGVDFTKLSEIRRHYDAENFLDEYSYIVKFHNPTRGKNEWFCPEEMQIKNYGMRLAFNYLKPDYSPKEEMADAYAFYVMDKLAFQNMAQGVLKSKYDFTHSQFSGFSWRKVRLKR